MTPRRDTGSRVHLLGRPPAGLGPPLDEADMIVDPVAQLEELADLYQRGLLGLEEYEFYKARVLDLYR